jgi:hypothetical protein
MPIEVAPDRANSLWIMSKQQDLFWIFGGALASLMVPVILLLFPFSILWLFWIWIIIFDNTHLWSTYSRTYFDKKFIKENKSIVWGSLLYFFIPVLFSFFYVWQSNKFYLDAFLFFAQSWAIYHVVRQHYGYLSLYDRKNKTPIQNHKIHKFVLFALIGGSYLHFLMMHPFNRKTAGFLPIEESLMALYFGVLLKISLITIFVFYVFWAIRKRNENSTQATLFNFVCILLYSSIFLYFSYLEPFFTLAHKPIQFFMGIAIMISLFHDLQYHGLVWFHNKNRYLSEAKGESKNKFGIATILNINFGAYCFFALIFSVCYGVFLWLTGEYTWLNGQTYIVGFAPIAFGVWWGFLFHHYYLDQKIWRIKKSVELQKSFSITENS